jgi:MtN3 and saliva related transmembrane protein
LCRRRSKLSRPATRDLKGISLKSYAITIFGLSLWMAYGVLLKQWPLIVSNALCVSLCIVIVTMKLLRSPKS